MAKKTPSSRKKKPAAKAARPATAKPKAKAGKPPAKPLAKVSTKAPAKLPAKTTAPKPVVKVTAPKEDASKSARKGITIVSQKVVKKAKPKTPSASLIPASVGRLLDPKGPTRKPLIPSGPRASHQRPLGMQGPEVAVAPRAAGKSPFGKKELSHFRTILVRKRSELMGDVSQMETEALQGNSGSLSNLPQHLAEQGSDAYDQSLSLDLAAADRKLIKEIEDAIKRIDEGTYGICEATGKPIKAERLEELPWARYSIEAARERERRSMRA